MVLRNHPEVAYLHCIDHWLLNRNKKDFLAKIQDYRKTRKRALCEIRETQYDLALSVYTWSYPDFMDIAWCAGIPVRLGLRRSLLAPLATQVSDLPENHFVHQSELQAQVLRPLNLDSRHLKKRRATLPESTPEAIQEVCALLNVRKIGDRPYCVIHMGSGAPIRELPHDVWREVAEALVKSHTLIFTGRGERERANAATVISRLGECINACDRLSWEGFVAAVRFANAVYGVESMAGHVAAAVGTRCVVAYTGMAGVARWRPESQTCTVLTQHVPCAPCEKPRGCKEMTCIRAIRAINFEPHFATKPSDKRQIQEGAEQIKTDSLTII